MSYLLDTNVVSELRKKDAGRADRNVVRWSESVRADWLYLSVISLFEIELGARRIERRDPVQGAILLDLKVIPAFRGHILTLDLAVARRAASLHVPDPRPERDTFIGATALENGMTVVTRNIRDFSGLGVQTLNPWDWP